MRRGGLRTSYFAPVPTSVLTVIQSTDKKLLKLALYAVDKTALLLNRSPVGPIAREFLALLEAYERYSSRLELPSARC
jgi:hypothetical protein